MLYQLRPLEWLESASPDSWAAVTKPMRRANEEPRHHHQGPWALAVGKGRRGWPSSADAAGLVEPALQPPHPRPRRPDSPWCMEKLELLTPVCHVEIVTWSVQGIDASACVEIRNMATVGVRAHGRASFWALRLRRWGCGRAAELHSGQWTLTNSHRPSLPPLFVRFSFSSNLQHILLFFQKTNCNIHLHLYWLLAVGMDGTNLQMTGPTWNNFHELHSARELQSFR
jgi:hypothetical protein